MFMVILAPHTHTLRWWFFFIVFHFCVYDVWQKEVTEVIDPW